MAMAVVPDLQYIAAAKSFESHPTGSLPQVYQDNNLQIKKAMLAWFNTNEDDALKDGLFTVGFNTLVGTQWNFKQNLAKYKFSAVFLVEDIYDYDERRAFKDLRKLHNKLKQRTKTKAADSSSQKCYFVTVNCPTNNFQLKRDDIHRLADNFPLFLSIMGDPNCGPVLFVQSVNTDDFMPSDGIRRGPEDRMVGKGPAKMPSAAFALATTFTANALGVTPDCVHKKLWNLNPRSWRLVNSSLKKITDHWWYVRDHFAFIRRVANDNFERQESTKKVHFAAFDRLMLLIRAQFEAQQIEWEEDAPPAQSGKTL